MINWFVQAAPSIGLLFFSGAFVGIAVWALQPSRKEKLQTLAEIPLNEENTHG